MSGEYDRVFPMDIMPEQLVKAMIAKNLDKMEQLGAYEVAPEEYDKMIQLAQNAGQVLD